MANNTTIPATSTQTPAFGGPTDLQVPGTSGCGGATLDSSGNGALMNTAGNITVTATTAGATVAGAVTATSFSNGTLGGVLSDTVYAVYYKTVTITSAAAATPVTIIADALVPAGKKAYLVSWKAKVNGGTLWGTTATVAIQDSNGTPVPFVTLAVAALGANAVLLDGTSNVTLENAYILGTGGTTAKGLVLKGDANGTGSDLVVNCLIVIK